MITLEQYVGPHAQSKDWTEERQDNAVAMLSCVNALKAEMEADGVRFHTNPNTKTNISGKTYGGFRPQDCPQGAPTSSHKTGMGIDLYDPFNEIDAWLLSHQDRLEAHGLYIEHPSATDTWSHWTTRAPKSGRRIFYP